MGTDGALEVRDLHLAYAGEPVLLGVHLDVPAHTTMGLLGASGSGKTTVLRCIAGLEQPDRGEIRLGGRVLSGPGEFLAPERRRTGMVFQDLALFGHLTVAENVGFGLPRGARTGPRVAEALELVDLAGFADRLPGTLSGGQQQRVALARALAPRPEVLLLDEPFSSLDSGLRVRLRGEVHRLLAELSVTAVFVTHDRHEAFALSDHLAVLDGGRVAQAGTPRHLYEQPSTPAIAALTGDANLLAGAGSGASAATALGAVPLRAGVQGPCRVLLRPEQVAVEPGGEAVVELVEYGGATSTVHARLGDLVVVATAARTDLLRGDRVTIRADGSPSVAWR